MLRPAASSVVLTAAFVILCAAQAAAASPAPNPPPGSAGVQPAAVTAGDAGVSTRQASASSDGTASQCGVQAAGGGAGYSAPPAQVGPSGASTPTCNATTGSEATDSGAQASSSGRGAAAGQTSTDASRSPAFGDGDGMATKQKLIWFDTGESGAGNSLTALIWLGLLLLLALFFVLLGIALGRRRRTQAAA